MKLKLFLGILVFFILNNCWVDDSEPFIRIWYHPTDTTKSCEDHQFIFKTKTDTNIKITRLDHVKTESIDCYYDSEFIGKEQKIGGGSKLEFIEFDNNDSSIAVLIPFSVFRDREIHTIHISLDSAWIHIKDSLRISVRFSDPYKYEGPDSVINIDSGKVIYLKEYTGGQGS